MAGYDENDADTRPLAAPAFRETMAEKPPTPPRLAFVRTPVWDKADAEARAAFEGLAKRLGDSVATVDLPDDYRAAWDDQRVIMYTDMAHNFGELVERGGDASSKQLRDLVAEGSSDDGIALSGGARQRQALCAGISDILKQYDAIMTPSAPGVAPKGKRHRQSGLQYAVDADRAAGDVAAAA